MSSIEELLGIHPKSAPSSKIASQVSFSFLFFSDVRKEIADKKKYEFTRDITLFADREGFTAIYIPERHFYEFGSIFANSAIMASYLIPQTKRIRFRTAGISLPLHHPAEVVEWWAMNDILSDGRIDLGFGSGWNKPDFILAPDMYEHRREIMQERITQVQKLWRGETILFPGPGGEDTPITVYPRPIQKEVNIWLLSAQNEESFRYAGKQGHNIFTMLYGVDLEAMGKKIAIYRQARKEAGYDPETGIVSLMLHTLVHQNRKTVEQAVEKPFKEYIKSALSAHIKAGLGKDKGATEIGEEEKTKMLEYSYQRYFKTGAIFGTVEEGKERVDQAFQVGVNDIAFLVDFGVDYSLVKSSFPYLKSLISYYI